MPPRQPGRVALDDDDWDEDGVPSSPTRRKSADTRRKTTTMQKTQQIQPAEPPARMPRWTRAAAAATGVQPVAGSQDPDRRARSRARGRGAPVHQNASPPRPSTPKEPRPRASNESALPFVQGLGPRLRPARPGNVGILPALPSLFRNKKKVRGGAHAQRFKRPRQQVQVVDLEENDDDEYGFDDLRDPEHTAAALFSDDVDYFYDPRDFEDDDEQEEREIATSVGRGQDRSRSVRFSQPGTVKMASREARVRDASRTRGTSFRVAGAASRRATSPVAVRPLASWHRGYALVHARCSWRARRVSLDHGFPPPSILVGRCTVIQAGPADGRACSRSADLAPEGRRMRFREAPQTS